MAAECIFCGPVNEYVTLADSFSQDLAETLLFGVRALFMSLAGVWATVTGLKMVIGAIDEKKIAHEFIYIIIAAGLLNAQGSDLANTVYRASLSTMAGAAAMVLTTGPLADNADLQAEEPPDSTDSQIADLDGMAMLIYTAEQSIREIMTAAGVLWEKGGFGYVAAVLLIIPYGINIVLFAAEVVVSIFSILLISLFSPVMIMAVGFGFLRSLTTSGLKNLLAIILIMFASSAALAFCLYGVRSLHLGNEISADEIGEMTRSNNVRLWMVIIMGWVSVLLLGRATAIAASLAQSPLNGRTTAALADGALSPVRGAMRLGKTAAGMGINKLRGKSSDNREKGGGDNEKDGGGGSLRDRLNNPGIDNGSSSPTSKGTNVISRSVGSGGRGTGFTGKGSSRGWSR